MKLFIIVLVLAFEAIVARRPKNPREQLKLVKIIPDGPGGKMVDAEPALNRHIKQKKHRTARKDPYQYVEVSPSAPVSYRNGHLNVEADMKYFKRKALKRSQMKATGPRTARQELPPNSIPVSRQGLPPVPSVWAGGATIPTTTGWRGTTALGALGLLKLKTAASLAFSRSKRSADEKKHRTARKDRYQDVEADMKYFKRKAPSPKRSQMKASGPTQNRQTAPGL